MLYEYTTSVVVILKVVPGTDPMRPRPGMETRPGIGDQVVVLGPGPLSTGKA